MKKVVNYLPLWLVELSEKRILKNPQKIEHLLKNTDPEVIEIIGNKKTLASFRKASKNVPAYKDFLQKNKINPKKVINIEFFDGIVPNTDKNNYIKEYSYEDRCLGGKFPKTGNIDESSGSTGHPMNWIRSTNEEKTLTYLTQYGFQHLFAANENTLVISCWSSGAWATGVKFCEIVEKFALVKNVSTDREKAIQTVKTFGSKYNYILTGYPQFIKELIESKEINWKKYHVKIMTGGDGVPAGWEEYLKKYLRDDAKVISVYGSSDIDIGVAFETEFTQKIRKACMNNKKLRKTLFNDENIPMIFQYNPTLHHITNVVIDKKREFVITALDRNIASPKIKYAIHDEGGRLGYTEMKNILSDHKVRIPEELKLPFLYIFGRSDGTISLDGANIYPEQVERAILEDKLLAKKMNKIMLEKHMDKKHNASFIIHIELAGNITKSAKTSKRFEKTILHWLLENNADYRESYENNKRLRPRVKLYNMRKGPFLEDSKRLKHKAILQHL